MNELAIRDETVQLGTMVLASPADVVHSATAIAKELARIVNERRLYRQISGRKFVYVEGWTTMGGMLGIVPREAEKPVLTRFDDGYEEYEATVELVRVSDGAIVGRASAIVGTDEPTWAKRPRYARRSMALTRATGKAYRMGFSWIMNLAGYEPTPAEEMDFVEGSYTDKQPLSDKPVKKNGNGQSFNPVQALVDAGISSDNHAAAGLLNHHVPADIRSDKDELLAWGKLYRAWRDAGTDPQTAAENATAGASPE